MPRVAAVVLVWLVAAPAAADQPPEPASATGQDSLAPVIAGLFREGDSVASARALGAAWDQLLERENWNLESATAVRFAREIATRVESAITHPNVDPRARTALLTLLTELPVGVESTFLTGIVQDPQADPEWVRLAAEALAQRDDPWGVEVIRTAFLLGGVSSGNVDVPDDRVFAMCHALSDADDAWVDERVISRARALFAEAPAPTVRACFPLLRRVPDIGTIAASLLSLLPAERGNRDAVARGAALIVVGHVRPPSALSLLAAGVREPSLRARPIRDGAAQGLAAYGGPRARTLVRDALSDPERRLARLAHAALRLGDTRAQQVLRAVALDTNAEVELRLAAANAYTLLAPAGRASALEWNEALDHAPLGSPFESLDQVMHAFGARLEVAAECGRDLRCAERLASSPDPQVAARALWDLALRPPAGRAAQARLAAFGVQTVLSVAPGQELDRVAAAVALLARLPARARTPHLPDLARARLAWRGRATPMHLPFDIAAAIDELAEVP